MAIRNVKESHIALSGNLIYTGMLTGFQALGYRQYPCRTSCIQ